MSKIIILCLVLCAVAINLHSVFAASSDDIEMIINECTNENGVTEADLHAAMGTEDVKLIESCFWRCALKKAGFINEKGEYDVDNGMIFVLKTMPELKERKEYTIIKEMAKQCESVYVKAASDGKAGCDRAALAAACIAEQMITRRNEMFN